MKKAQILTISFALIAVLAMSLTSAIIVNSVNTPIVSPGGQGTITIELENILNQDVEDVSITLDLKDIPFIVLGSSEQSIDEIDEDDDEEFIFEIKSAPDAAPGNYEIPYTIKYTESDDEVTKEKKGTFGVRISADPDLVFTASSNGAILGQESVITFKVINKGFFDARFVSVRIIPEGFILLSDKDVYIGTVDSDDFETETFTVIFEDDRARFIAIIEYKDFENDPIITSIDLPLKVYTQDEAIKLGIIKRSATPAIVGAIVTIILIWILWRTLRKRSKQRKSESRVKEEEKEEEPKKKKKKTTKAKA